MRGRFNVSIKTEYLGKELFKEIVNIPGVSYDRESKSIVCTPCAVDTVRKELGDLATEASQTVGAVSIYETELKDILRGYQNEAATALAMSPWRFLVLPMRAGKTLTALAACDVADAQRVLIVCPAIARLVWANEIERWLGERALLLYGRGANKVRPWGDRLYIRGEVETDLTLLRPRQFTIVNYDLLIPQSARRSTGVVYNRDDLPGWAERLSTIPWDVVIFDEVHLLRGRSSGRQKAAKLAAEKARRAWGLTGTPIYSYTRDLWGQLDVLSGGLFGEKPFGFDVRYCGAEHRIVEEIGRRFWWADGVSNEDELRQRTRHWFYEKTRDEILPEMPEKIRTKQLIEGTDDLYSSMHSRGDREARTTRLMRASLKVKTKPIAESVFEEMRLGGKVIVFAKLRESASVLAKAIEKRASKIPGALVQSANGSQSADARAAMCKVYVDHDGPACIVSTIDAMPGAVSLRGAQTVHFAEFHSSPKAMAQAEERPFELGAKGLTIVYWIVKDSYDEHAANILIPKIEALVSTMRDQDAKLTGEAIGEDDMTEAEIWDLMASYVEDREDLVA